MKKIVEEIDQLGIYPKEEILKLASRNYFGILKEPRDIKIAVNNISQIAEMCGTIGFCMWCQFQLIWYVLNTKNKELKDELLPKLYSGEILGGTALSSAYKAFSGIEQPCLKAQRMNDGYIITGRLKWVSNIDENSVFAVVAFLPNGTPIMGIVRCNDIAIKLGSHVKYSAMQGASTKVVALQSYFMPFKDVLGDHQHYNIYEYLLKITPGYLVLQCAIAAGIIRASLDEIELTTKDAVESFVNSFLPMKYRDLKKEYDDFFDDVEDYARGIEKADIKDLYKLRLKASMLTQKMTNAALLFCGTNGYFKTARVARIQRESNFMLLITPSIKHILKDLKDIEENKSYIDKFRIKTLEKTEQIKNDQKEITGIKEADLLSFETLI